jgi:putative PIN family toxin of toxin-antitoxin system
VNEKLRIVIDTQVLLRAVINRRSLPAQIVYDLIDTYILLVSEATLKEIEDVLNRPKVRTKFQLSDEVVQELMERLSRGERITVTEVPAVGRDPKDDIFLACGVVGKAEYIVSEDNDLLVLNPYQSIKIVNVLDFLKIIRPPQKTAEDSST